MIWTIISILLVLWVAGYLMHFGGSFIHILLIVAVIVVIGNILGGRRGV